jgi:hypothetical protein
VDDTCSGQCIGSILRKNHRIPLTWLVSVSHFQVWRHPEFEFGKDPAVRDASCSRLGQLPCNQNGVRSALRRSLTDPLRPRKEFGLGDKEGEKEEDDSLGPAEGISNPIHGSAVRRQPRLSPLRFHLNRPTVRKETAGKAARENNHTHRPISGCQARFAFYGITCPSVVRMPSHTRS